ncbi:hypothetical protein ACHAXT_006758 [Thalassiosira profunda]
MFSTTTKLMASWSKGRRNPLGNRMWMPTMPMILLNSEHATATSPATAAFRVLPKMTKHEVKEYLTKIYGLPVVQVRTQNYLGKRMRIVGSRTIAYGKRPDFKKAFVTFRQYAGGRWGWGGSSRGWGRKRQWEKGNDSDSPTGGEGEQNQIEG